MSDTAVDPWSRVVGQDELVRLLRAAVANPVHAFLLVGPPGAGTKAAAFAFAADLLARDDPSGADRHRRLAAAGQHPDVYVLDPTGNQLRRDEEAEPLIVEASRSPVEATHKVLIVDRFHTATPAAPLPTWLQPHLSLPHRRTRRASLSMPLRQLCDSAVE